MVAKHTQSDFVLLGSPGCNSTVLHVSFVATGEAQRVSRGLGLWLCIT